ncbi:sporulation integral membrane protein YtvI [Virgibacillus ihumii]|uniref:sporulation integral membrane protein YtvI n=1 Tax=Virgibacillus ihumii TaxID=2686091 RepID=UPI00157D64D2|nr:sporulation integral membrane protein YtvI [Virgibacillus ihumii]
MCRLAGMALDRHIIYPILRLVLTAGSLILLTLLLHYSFEYLYPFILAGILAYLLHPFVSFAEQRLKMPRVIASFAVLTSSLLLLTGIVIFVIVEFIQGSAYLAEQIPAHFQTFIRGIEEIIENKVLPFYHKLTSFFHTLNPPQQEAINNYITEFIDQFAVIGTEFLYRILMTIPQTLTALPGSLTVTMFVVIAAFFIINDWHMIAQSIKKMIPEAVHETCLTVWNHLRKAIFGYMKAQLFLISLTTLIIYIGLLIIGMEYPMTVALLAALVDMLPFIGTGIIFIPWISYLFLTGNYEMTIPLTVLYMTVVIQRQLIEPKVISSNIGLNPLTVLIAIFAGLQIWGIAGLIIGPILLIIIQALHEAGVISRLWQFIKG